MIIKRPSITSSALPIIYANNNHHHHYLWRNGNNFDSSDLSTLDGHFNHSSGNNNDELGEGQEEHSKHCRHPSIDSTLTISPIHATPSSSSITATNSPNASITTINNNLQSIAPAPHPDFLMGKLDVDDSMGCNSASIRRRTQLTSLQVKVLHRVLEHTPFPTKAMRDELATMLGITTKTIQIWFQNQRAKAKQRMRRSRALASLNSAFGGLAAPGQSSMGPVPRMFETNPRRENGQFDGHFSDDANSELEEEISIGGDKAIESNEFFPLGRMEVPKLPLSPLRPNNKASSPPSLPSPHPACSPNYHSARYGAWNNVNLPLNFFPMSKPTTFSNYLLAQSPEICMNSTIIPIDSHPSYSPTSMSIEGDSASWLTSPLMAETVCSSPLISPTTARQDIQMVVQLAMREAIHQMDQNKILLAPLTATYHDDTSNEQSNGWNNERRNKQRTSKVNNDDLFSGLELSNLPGLNSPLFGIDSCMDPLEDLVSGDGQSTFGAEIHVDFAHFLPNL